MARGKKTPNEIKKVQGTYRTNEAPQNPFVPDQFDGVPEPPDDLGKIGKMIWQGTVKELHEKGMLYNIDIPMLHIYCQEYDNYQEAEKKLRTEGRVVEQTNKNGSTNLVQSPWINIKSKSWEVIKSLSLQFGLTPVSRNKIELPKKEDGDPLAFLNE